LALFDTELNKYWKYDFCYGKNIIEVHGDYWHCNPDTYDENTVVRGGQTASVIWKNDARKIECAHYYGYKVLTLWENEIQQDIKRVLQKCLTYLQNTN
jgi:very-short-patch-repair endonuclease